MGDPEDERCACPCRPCRAARWGLTRSGIYRHRWQWWAAWGVTDFWLPRVFKGGSEWCEVPLCFVVPPLGCFVIYPPGRRRVMPCAECWAERNEVERADYAPCGRYHAGRINWNGHAHWETGVCADAAEWLRTAEPA
jgi:hypothetical protein